MYTFSANRKKYLVDSKSIIYMESNGRQINIVLDSEAICFYGTLKVEYEKLKAGNYSGFVQINRSAVINVNHIKYTDYDNVKMDNGKMLVVTRKYKESVERYILMHNLLHDASDNAKLVN